MDRLSGPSGVLFDAQLRRWISARGFWLVVAAALVPMILTGSWVFTHTSDVAVTDLTLTPEDPVRGDVVEFVATVENVGDEPVGEFNASLNVGPVQQRTLRPIVPPTQVTVEGLEPGETATLNLTWPAQTGSYYAVGLADVDGELKEVEATNNQKAVPFVVEYPEPGPDEGPEAPGNLTGNESASAEADVAVVEVSRVPQDPQPGQSVGLGATFENRGNGTAVEANLTLRVGRVIGGALVPTETTSEVVTLAPGESTDVTLTWTAREGVRWVEAFANVTDEDVHDPDGGNNHDADAVVVQPVAGGEPPEPPEASTVKAFYRIILDVLYLPILLPLLSLYYAGGLISDERRDGTLPYLLTRPLPRWLLPASKFAAGFLVAAAAVTVGLVATFALLFVYSTAGSVSFLTGPLVLSLLSLFVYGAGFTLLAVLVDRPYLLGLVFVVGWEAIVGNLVPWVQNLTVSFHLGNLLDAWWNTEDLVFRAAPDWDAGLRPLLVLVGAGIGFLLLAGLAMKYKEFPDA